MKKEMIIKYEIKKGIAIIRIYLNGQPIFGYTYRFEGLPEPVPKSIKKLEKILDGIATSCKKTEYDSDHVLYTYTISKFGQKLVLKLINQYLQDPLY